MGTRTELKNYIEKIIKERAARELSKEERRKWDSCPVVLKDENGNVSMFALGSDVIRFKNKEMAEATMDAVMRSFDETE
jgi:hypothetical protein